MATNDDETPKHHSKKNTRKWCKGKKRVLHSPVWQKSHKYSNFDYLELTCTQCSKVLDFWLDAQWSRSRWVRPIIGSSAPLEKVKEEEAKEEIW